MGDGMPADLRISYIESRVLALTKSKSELFQKMLGTEEADCVRRFVNEEGCNRLFFTAAAKDMFVTEKLPDAKQKKKVVLVMKTAEVKYDEKKVDEMFDTVIVTDLLPAVLNSFHETLRCVYLPILTNPRNTTVSDWPSKAAQPVEPPCRLSSVALGPFPCCPIPHRYAPWLCPAHLAYRTLRPPPHVPTACRVGQRLH